MYRGLLIAAGGLWLNGEPDPAWMTLNIQLTFLQSNRRSRNGNRTVYDMMPIVSNLSIPPFLGMSIISYLPLRIFLGRV